MSLEFLTNLIFILNLLKTLFSHFSCWVVALSVNRSQSNKRLDKIAADCGHHVQSQRPVR